MICERCQGTGQSKTTHYIEILPCPHCMGNGISYCCDDAGANPPNSAAAIVESDPLTDAINEAP
jgi:hypothetical protein